MAVDVGNTYPVEILAIPGGRLRPDTDRFRLFPEVRNLDLIAYRPNVDFFDPNRYLELLSSGTNRSGTFNDLIERITLFLDAWIYIKVKDITVPFYLQITGATRVGLNVFARFAAFGIRIPVTGVVSRTTSSGVEAIPPHVYNQIETAYIITSPGRQDSDGVTQAVPPGIPTEISDPPVTLADGTARILDFQLVGTLASQVENITVDGEAKTVIIGGKSPTEGCELQLFGIQLQEYLASNVRMRLDGLEWNITRAAQISSESYLVQIVRDI